MDQSSNDIETLRRQAELSAFLKASRAILELHEFNTTARLIFDSCKDLIGAQSGYVALLSEDGTENEVLFLESGGLPCNVDPSLPMPIRGLRGDAYRLGKTVYENNFMESAWIQFMPQGHVRLENVLFAPLVIGGKTVGLLGLANKPGGFTENDAVRATSFGELAAIALLNSRNLQLLADSEKKYRNLVDNAIVGVYQTTLEGNILYANDALLKMLEFASLQEARQYNTLTRYRYPERREILTNELLKEGKVTNFELELLTKTGAARNVMLSAALDGEVLTGMIIDVTEKKRAEEKFLKRHSELAALYEVAAALSRTIDMKELFDIVLNTVTGLKDLSIERKGGILLVEDGAMRIASHLGHSKEFLDLHRDMKVGECLCGQAVLTGEVIISKNSDSDTRHTIRYPGMAPHGHVVIPLKAKDKVLGVLYLYLPADIELDEDRINLLRYISSQIGMALDNARLYEQTRELSLHDPLTGLANRRLMDIIFERNIAASNRRDIPFSCLMIDIDHFKKYNDTFGHPSGDRLLREIAGIISGEIRAVDFAVRYGGEEFLVLLSEMDSAKACEVAERLRKSVQDKTGVTISLGISAYDGAAGKETLIQRADEALYSAKQKGRNRVEVTGGQYNG